LTAFTILNFADLASDFVVFEIKLERINAAPTAARAKDFM
jgi:hypothetical protein